MKNFKYNPHIIKDLIGKLLCRFNSHKWENHETVREFRGGGKELGARCSRCKLKVTLITDEDIGYVSNPMYPEPKPESFET